MARFKILIIEDELTHLNVMKAKLEFEGYEVLTAKDGEEGFSMIKSENPALVLLDIILPRLDGFGVLERVRRENITIPVIVVSNSGQPVEIDRALKAGARDYLVKAEFNPGDVLEKVKSVLGDTSPSKSGGAQQAASGTAPAEEKAGEKAPPGGTNKILIIEDDKFLRDLIVQKLKREGFVPHEAIDGEGGLKVATEEKPDLILLDLILPSVDGFEVLKRLKGDPQTVKIPVIILSNLGQKEDMDRAISGGAEAFMIKAHFTPGEIITKIREVLKKQF